MTIRRRRWLRRLAIGISFATFVTPAAARPDEGGAGGTRAEISSVRPDDRADRFTGVQRTQFVGNAVRPDDRASRFAVTGAVSETPAPTPVTDADVSWDGAVTLGLGTLVLVLALGLGLGYIRRPRIAGL